MSSALFKHNITAMSSSTIPFALRKVIVVAGLGANETMEFDVDSNTRISEIMKKIRVILGEDRIIRLLLDLRVLKPLDTVVEVQSQGKVQSRGHGAR